MSTRAENVRAAGVEGAGKDTGDGLQPSASGVHPAPAPGLPHLAYGDAVHAEIRASDPHPPEALEVGVRDGSHRALFMRLVWPPDHPGLGEAVREDGLTLAWSHVHGWRAYDRHGDDRLLALHVLAAPQALADAALHLAEHGLGCDWQPETPDTRWEHAQDLELALADWEDGEAFR